MTSYSVVGKGLPRLEGREKVTGSLRYGADYLLRDMLVGKFLRSPYPHARILHIDTSQALRLAGVKAVITAADAPLVRIGRWIQDRPILAQGKVCHVGEAVAAVAAVDEETADEALELIRVEYEELPPVLDPLEAMEGKIIVHEGLTDYEPLPAPPNCGGNILRQHHSTQGDTQRVWGECDLIHEDTYSTPFVYHAFLQPHEVTGQVDSSGKVTLWSSTKAPFAIRSDLAKALGLAMSKIRVIAAGVGGDFGGKGSASIEPVCALLTLKTGKPVRLALGRGEDFLGTFVRSRAIVQLKMGAKKDGTILAMEGRVISDVGAYCDSFSPQGRGGTRLQGPYRIPHMDVWHYYVYTNNPPTGHMRAPGLPQVSFAVESHVDALAKKLGIDPIEIRLRNGVGAGDTIPGAGMLERASFKRTVEEAGAYIRRHGSPGPNQGWGIASVTWGGGALEQAPFAASAAWVKMNEDGTVVLITGATEQGCGVHTALVQIVAEVLQVPVDSISVVASDTDATPYEMGTGGSRTTYRVGATVKMAAEDARRQLLRLASQRLEIGEEELEFAPGGIYPKGARDRRIDLAILARMALTSLGGPILGSSTTLRPQAAAAAMARKGVAEPPHYGTHACLVEVDGETGQVNVLKYLAVHDVGFVINPINVLGQIEGGVAFGLGYATTEAILHDRGRPLNANLMDYRIPTANRVPAVDSAVLEEPSEWGPFGAKSVAEPPTVPVAAAIANAIHSAVGARLRELPLTSERVYGALKEKPPG